MITHKFREVMAFADAVTVLRRGRLAGEARLADTSPAQLAEMMVGAREIPQAHAAKTGGLAIASNRASSCDDLVVDERQRAARRGATSACPCDRARSSASRACPATASASSWRR